jgi:hypothetical protein
MVLIIVRMSLVSCDLVSCAAFALIIPSGHEAARKSRYERTNMPGRCTFTTQLFLLARGNCVEWLELDQRIRFDFLNGRQERRNNFDNFDRC